MIWDLFVIIGGIISGSIIIAAFVVAFAVADQKITNFLRKRQEKK
jgi:hypothetical protein